ncbi:hypothetical protein B7486_60340, partial [cyanobacterium TDX16]
MSRTSTPKALFASVVVVGVLAGFAAVGSGAGAQAGGAPTPEDPGVAGAEQPEAVPSVEPVEVVPDRVIVTLDEDVAPQDVPALAQALAEDVGGEVLAELPQTLNGFALEVDEAGRAQLEAAPEVAGVAADTIVTGDAATVTDAAPYAESRPEELWNLDRISQRPLARDGVFSYLHDGSGVDVYVLDSGIRPDNVFFGGRVEGVVDVHAGPEAPPPTPNGVEPDPECTPTLVNPEYGSSHPGCVPVNTGGLDCNGHGTHVAGIAGADVYGVARDVTLHSVRVLNCRNSGT